MQLDNRQEGLTMEQQQQVHRYGLQRQQLVPRHRKQQEQQRPPSALVSHKRLAPDECAAELHLPPAKKQRMCAVTLAANAAVTGEKVLAAVMLLAPVLQRASHSDWSAVACRLNWLVVQPCAICQSEWHQGLWQPL